MFSAISPFKVKKYLLGPIFSQGQLYAAYQGFDGHAMSKLKLLMYLGEDGNNLTFTKKKEKFSQKYMRKLI